MSPRRRWLDPTLPILKYVVGMEAHAAVAASLFVVGVTSVAAVIPHARGGRVVWRTGLVFGVASMLGAFIAGSFASSSRLACCSRCSPS